jgi:copper(I)-binding protein
MVARCTFIDTGWSMKRVCASLGMFSLSFFAVASVWAAAPTAATSATPAEVTAANCWIRQLPSPAPSGGFLVFHNAGLQARQLTSVSSPDYGQVMMHQTTQENGMSKMSMVHQVAVPAGGSLAFKPGSYHLMLEQPRDGLKVGDHVQIEFVLDNQQQVSVSCEVKAPNAMPGMGKHGMKHMAH